MKKNLTELVFILDRSGSMCGLEDDTIGGFNSMIAQQRKTEEATLVSTVLFDDEAYVLHDRMWLEQVNRMTEDDYYVRGCTALLDAVGGAIHHIGNVHKYARNEDVPEKTLFVIITDGMENSSSHYNYSKVKKMISRQQEKYGWEFLFLGANIDAAAEAEKYGISADHAVDYECDAVGTQLNFNVVSDVVMKLRSTEDRACLIDAGWKEEIEKDYIRRHRK